MRAWLCVAAAALALALPPPAARARAPASALASPPSDDIARQDHIKRQILAKLGLSQRPRPKGAPPRDVLQQIWARAADPEPPPQPPAPPPSDNTREIIAIAQRGPTLKGQRVLEFRLGREARGPGGAEGDMHVMSAELLVRAETAPANRGRGSAEARRLRYTLWAFTVAGNGSALTLDSLAGTTRRDPSHAWQRLEVTEAARSWAARGWGGALRLVVDCSGCAGRVRLRLGGGEGARPLLRVRVATMGSRRRRRALECAAAPAGFCCRESYYVSFHTLGWDDWIVAPEGYHANYCRGACARTPDTFVYYHTQVVEAARMPVAACCAPLRFSPLSLIYFGDDSNIIKRDLPEMVVEECGCP